MTLKSVGDAVVTFDKSGYAAVGWSVLSFGLQLAVNDRDAREFVVSSSEIMVTVIDRWGKYQIYRDRAGSAASKFDECLIRGYKAALLYNIAMDDYIYQSGIGM